MLGLHTKSIEFSCWQTWGLDTSTNLLEIELLSTTNKERSLTVEQGPALPLWAWDSTVACLLQMQVQVPSTFAFWKQKLPFRWVFLQSLKQWLGIHPLAQDSYGLSDQIALFCLDTIFFQNYWCRSNTCFDKMMSLHHSKGDQSGLSYLVTSVQKCQAASLQQGVCYHHPPALPPRLRSPRMNNKFAPGFTTSKLQLSLKSVHPEPVSLPSCCPLVGLCYILASLSAISYYLKIICSFKICFIGL